MTSERGYFGRVGQGGWRNWEPKTRNSDVLPPGVQNVPGVR